MANIEDCPCVETFSVDVKAAWQAKHFHAKQWQRK